MVKKTRRAPEAYSERSASDGAVPRQAPLSTVPAWALAAAGALAAAE